MKTAKKNNKKVLVAMSGGVDSSVAATILKDQGFEVAGVFMHFWKEKNSKFENKCCSLEDEGKARSVANMLGIPFYVKEAENEFKKEVVDYFLRELKEGKTPNPCIQCNKMIKFKIMLEMMLQMKFDFIATGHYAQVREVKNQKSKIKNFKLIKAKDENKDQSYFLYNLTQKQLAKIIFPIGGYPKSEVRKLAKKFNLTVAEKPESQDICFIPEREPNEFIKRNIKIKSGNIIDLNGKLLGKHQGLPLYTIGQRKGLCLGGNGPYFVVRKDTKKNQLVVANDPENANLLTEEIEIGKVNWIIGQKKPFKALVKIRYRTPSVGAIIKPGKNITKIQFKTPQKAVTPGQSAVIYSESGEVIGGGIIK